jgi:AraC-binding-like domain
MKSWSFTTESYPDYRRSEAWRHILGKLSVEPRDGSRSNRVFATAQAIESPLGVVFAQIASGPQRLCYTDDAGTIWLVLHREGDASMRHADYHVPLITSDLLLGTGGATAEIRFTTNFRQLLVRVPRRAIGTRIVGPLGAKVARLSGHGGLGQVFAQLLASVADAIDTLDADAIRPIEIALAEFLAAGLAADREEVPARPRRRRQPCIASARPSRPGWPTRCWA